ncbi:MAG: FapA family protein [Sulfurimonas sp.]|nr:FapA family protein [Sulfurimonas sp.]MDQ7062211.1 FapA family protein [Sulfurimonas sp.]
MALFGSKEKKNTRSKKIRPTVLRTQNVAQELLALAKSYEIKVDTIDFNILEVQTYTRMNDGTKETEWEEISSDEIYELDDATALLNAQFQIKQMYEIEFFTKITQNNPFENFRVAVGANATKCKVYLSIKEGSSLSYSSRFEKDLKKHINKSKVRAGILINIFDEMLGEVVSKLIAHARVEENVTYKKNETILIGQSYEPTLTINDNLILHYDKEEETDEHKKKDYASRGFIKAVQKDEVLIEYVKAQLGKAGRNCRGEFMAPKEIEEKFTPTFAVDDTIREEDNPKNIEYIANENGYVVFEENIYGIKTDVDMGEISFKTTGNIISGLDSDVTVNVSEKDAVKDAIGMGMEVEVTEIDIDGNVGSNAKLRALRATISGQTHKTAEARADKLDINVHKGKAYGKNIHITRLEHGVVDGDEVKIAQALGGDIRANEIRIEICASHVKATASRLIEIKKMQGSENTFTIDPLLKKSSQHDLDDNSEKIKELERTLRDIKKDVDKYAKQIKEGTASFNDVKKRLMHYKKSGIKMPESFVKKYKQFQGLQAQLAAKKESYSLNKNELDIAKSKTSVFQSDIMDARIINRGGWKGFNELIFKLIEPPLDISYKPAEGSSGKVFGLVEVDEGEFEIQVIDE